MQLFYSARDMLDLFRAVVPVYHANEIESVPLLAMIFVNDCLYIAHHLMTLGYQFHVRSHTNSLEAANAAADAGPCPRL